MEEMLLKMAENSPLLALLGIVLVIVFRMGSRMITAFLNTLQSMNGNFEKLTAEIVNQNTRLENFINIVDECHIATLQAHQYQKTEHEQMIKVLERLNGK